MDGGDVNDLPCVVGIATEQCSLQERGHTLFDRYRTLLALVGYPLA